jgi:hypothetical protein
MRDGIENVVETIRGEVPARMKKENIPGLAMALVSKGGTEWLGCFGHTDQSKRKRVDRDTLFSLQSTTKTHTRQPRPSASRRGILHVLLRGVREKQQSKKHAKEALRKMLEEDLWLSPAIIHGFHEALARL